MAKWRKQYLNYHQTYILLPDHSVHLGELRLVPPLEVRDGLVGLLQLALRVALQQLETVLGLLQSPVHVGVGSLWDNVELIKKMRERSKTQARQKFGKKQPGFRI